MVRDPLIFLPGMMCDARVFEPQINALSASCRIDVGNLTRSNSVAGMAGDVLHGAPPRFALAGLSLGGIIAMEIYRQAPERVTRLALLDTNPQSEIDEAKAKRGPQIAKARDGQLHCIMRDEMKPNYLHSGPNRQAILDLCMAMAEKLGPEVFIRQSEALRDRADQQQTLRRVNVPTLILCGRHDALCPVSRHEAMHALIPHSTLTVVEDAGHLPTLEQADETTKALQIWLEND